MTKEEKRLVEKAKKIPHGTVRLPAQSRPQCDFCGSPALVDGKTKMGHWAFLCLFHYRIWGVGLGLGRGQVLLTDEEN